ncbi:MAG: (d)CMP kinase [Rhodobacteraceae bacterium]|nr:(d)CMP kinase [Paracoccaceae bacterium]
MQFTVAIDGPAAAGKGTIARAIAETFGFAHLDTGLLYRAVGAKMMMRGRGVIVPELAEKIALELTEADLERDDLRNARVAQAASKVAALPEVRAALLEFQKSFSKRAGGAVLDGRDIGSVICPDADVKLFITASDEVRARRRFEELSRKTPDTRLETVKIDLHQRDIRDASRDVAPMRAVEDALLLDTSKLSIDAAVAEAVALVKKRFEKA